MNGPYRKCSREMKGEWAYGENMSLLIATIILLLSVASERRKLLKTTNSESFNIRHGSLKNQFDFKQIIQILQPIAIDLFRLIRIQLIFHNIFIHFVYNALKTPK